MADQPNRKKRQVKNPETFRERAAKAVELADKPKLKSPLKRVSSATVGRIAKPIGSSLSKASKTKPARKLSRPARLIGKVLLPTYLRNSWQELKLVTWPNWNESRRLTYAVLIFAVIFGASIALVDYGLDKLFKSILLK